MIKKAYDSKSWTFDKKKHKTANRGLLIQKADDSKSWTFDKKAYDSKSWTKTVNWTFDKKAYDSKSWTFDKKSIRQQIVDF